LIEEMIQSALHKNTRAIRTHKEMAIMHITSIGGGVQQSYTVLMNHAIEISCP